MSGEVIRMLNGDVPGVLWPPLFSNQKASLAAFVQTLQQTQWMRPADIQIRQHRQLVALAQHFHRQSEPFRARLDAAGLKPHDFARSDGLAALPSLSRQKVQAKDNPIFVDALPAGHRPVAKVSTSGSTGEPVVVRRTAINRLQWLGMTMRYNLWSEKDFSGGICAIRANLTSPGPGPNWGSPMSFFFKTGPGMRIDIRDDIGRQLDIITEFKPATIVAYPSNVVALLDEMDARGLDLPSLKTVRTIGETLPGSLRERVRERLSASVYDCYSSEELGYLAMQCPAGDLYHTMAETHLIEVVRDDGTPCGDGETGRILVTDLHNHATPMIRYEIGDHAQAGPRCDCRRGLPTLRRILGRERNLVVKPDGTRNWPLTGFKGFRDIAPIRQYQLRQHSLEKVEVRLVTERPLTPDEEARLRDHIVAALGHAFAIDFSYFEGRIPTGRNGKFEEFVRLF